MIRGREYCGESGIQIKEEENANAGCNRPKYGVQYCHTIYFQWWSMYTTAQGQPCLVHFRVYQ